DHMFPREKSPSTLYHYTSIDALRGIASSEELRLYPIRKRIGEGGEMEAFARAHRLDGYLTKDQGDPYYKEMSNDIFYVSLTRTPPKDPSYMWSYFSHGSGVRLEFIVWPKAAELRPVYYEQAGTKTLLADINSALAAAGAPPFVPHTLSWIGAFYLSSLVSSEDEVRLMMKRQKGGPDLTQSDGQFDYWPIPIGPSNAICELDLSGIHVAPGGDLSKVTNAISGTAFSSISPTGP
ncbi:hypothetical protein, partial [Labrenzia sp. 011]|uniref:hypothetical protein n=1 Tax=Labrenzia sp. 011 TaxID=2171494 RepID=UPI00197C75D0